MYFTQDGFPINRIVGAWSLPKPPPFEISLDFLSCLHYVRCGNFMMTSHGATDKGTAQTCQRVSGVQLSMTQRRILSRARHHTLLGKHLDGSVHAVFCLELMFDMLVLDVRP